MSEYDDICNQVADETASQFSNELDRLRQENEKLKKYIRKLQPNDVSLIDYILRGK